MSKPVVIMEKPVTGEWTVARIGTAESGGELLEDDLYVRPGGAVVDEHVNPIIEEAFTIVRGQFGFRIAGHESIAELNKRLVVTPGVAHDWWNAGEEEAHVIVEIRPELRFEEMAKNLYGLAQDGKTNAKGMPNLLQGAILAREFEDVMYFTKPPRVVQRLLFGPLAVIARALGYKGRYPKYADLELPSGGQGEEPPSTAAVVGRAATMAAMLLLTAFLLLLGWRRHL